MLLTTMVAVICVIALVVALVRFTNWRTQVQAAESEQLRLAQTYDFNPGNIISDGQFFNGSAMSQAEVQAFLQSQGGALASMTFDTSDESGESLCQDYTGAKGESAAAIITKAGQACGVSQKVLLTVLQKEQHLVAATNPSDFQIKSAMGLNCPDDADCDPAYAGFFRQVYGAAKRYRYYAANEDRYGYHAGALNYIQYHPNEACGGSEVYIENKATALLYIYTPYQPNLAALAAGGGEGDSCSSYGNRNFALIYQSWFGSPRS
ncbi:hemagglutinin [Bifidobacterium oedipodis]|uniref:Hemagglutinin n=1 Tax=Bifidobacterium oedipodis TaxID=2675322 RepID=A0A7Y0HQI1_9BIFI|nr:hemagglutinin [Bifidobacterium sp. DSM 109957]NMM92925.1 hemagglutinin [Bifidobacterium sp. DSM 109957]